MSRTIRANIECRLRAENAGIDATFMPVIQGRHPGAHERCAVALAHMLERAGLVGVGSMCRRPVPGAVGMIAVVDRLDPVLTRQTRLLLLGFKGAPYPYPTGPTSNAGCALKMPGLIRPSYRSFRDVIPVIMNAVQWCSRI